MAKKRANGEGNIRKRDNGTWEGRITVEGKTHSVYGKTKSDVREKLTQVMHQADTGSLLDKTDMTVEEWLDTWLRLWNKVKDSSQRSYQMHVKNHILPAIGKKKLSKLNPLHIQTLLEKMKEEGYAKGTVKVTYLVLHKSLKKAVRMKLISSNPCDNVDFPVYDTSSRQMRQLLDDEVSRFLQAIKGNELEYLLFVALFTGLRITELMSLTWDCIDFQHETLHVYRQLVNCQNHKNTQFTSLKNGKDRTILLPSSVLQAFRMQRKKQAKEQLLIGMASDPNYNPEHFVFTNAYGERLCHSAVYVALKKIAWKIGIPNLRLHDLRHSYATLSLQNGVDPKTVSKNLGHASVAFTLNVYAEASKTMQRNSADKLEAFIQNL